LIYALIGLVRAVTWLRQAQLRQLQAAAACQAADRLNAAADISVASNAAKLLNRPHFHAARHLPHSKLTGDACNWPN
jgi:hypothetical protein